VAKNEGDLAPAENDEERNEGEESGNEGGNLKKAA
jgi:hypothetical protein